MPISISSAAPPSLAARTSRRRAWRRAGLAGLAGFALGLSACVFPNLEPTGIELAWRFMEGNMVDGDAARRTRTCEGARGNLVRVGVTDTQDPERAGTFTYECELGFETLESLQVDPSEVFLSLRAGTYEVEIAAIDVPGVAFATDTDEVEVARKAVTLHAPPLTLPVVPWTLRLGGTQTCTEASFRLVYRDAEAALVDPTGGTGGSSGSGGSGGGTGGGGAGGGGTGGGGTGGGGTGGGGAGLLYRSGLISAAGLRLDGSVTPCAKLAGPHPFADLDLGDYALEISVDGGPLCSLALRIDRPELEVEVDLANLPCAG